MAANKLRDQDAGYRPFMHQDLAERRARPRRQNLDAILEALISAPNKSIIFENEDVQSKAKQSKAKQSNKDSDYPG